MNNLSQNENTKDEERVPICDAKVIVNGELVECLELKASCQQYINFGESIYCTHPLKLEIAKKSHEKNK